MNVYIQCRPTSGTVTYGAMQVCRLPLSMSLFIILSCQLDYDLSAQFGLWASMSASFTCSAILCTSERHLGGLRKCSNNGRGKLMTLALHFQAILAAPQGVVRLMDLLGDPHEVIRNEALLLLTGLTRASADIQKIAAFEGAFDRILHILECASMRLLCALAMGHGCALQHFSCNVSFCQCLGND